MMDLIAVPSGQDIQLAERRLEHGSDGLLVRLRYIAPDLDGLAFDAAAQDMDHLCAAFVADPSDLDAVPDRIIVSLSQRPIDFGATDASVTQYFEVYSVQEGSCQVELF